MTALAARLIGAPTASALSIAEDRLYRLSANDNAAWTIWYANDGWMVGRHDTHDAKMIDEYGPHLCPRSAAFHAESLELEWSRFGDPVFW